MSNFDINEIIEEIKENNEQNGRSAYVQLPEEFFQHGTEEQAEKLAQIFKSNTLIKLPQKEVKFFEWLKINDNKVWKDLWGEDDDEVVYLVGISFIKRLLYRQGRGYPICDLLNCDNYYFTEHHIQDEESKVHVEAATERFRNKKDLSIEQLLALEISIGSIDIWHFAYKHSIELDRAKEAVDILVKDDALVHLKDSEHLVPFIDF